MREGRASCETKGRECSRRRRGRRERRGAMPPVDLSGKELLLEFWDACWGSERGFIACVLRYLVYLFYFFVCVRFRMEMSRRECTGG